MWLCRFWDRQVGILNIIIHPGLQELHYLMFRHSLYKVIFLQAAIMFKTRPGSSQNVAVPVPEPAISIFQIILFIRESKNYIIYDVPAFSLSSYFYSSCRNF